MAARVGSRGMAWRIAGAAPLLLAGLALPVAAAGAQTAAVAPPAAQLPGRPGAVVPGFRDGGMRQAPDYVVPYGRASEASIRAVMDRVLARIDADTPTGLIDAAGKPVTGAVAGAHFQPGFSLTSYEWGVTYSGALLAGQVLGDKRYTQYVADRLGRVVNVAAEYRRAKIDPRQSPLRDMLAPGKLDDSGSMAAALIKAQRAGVVTNGRPQIDIYLDWVANKQSRLADGTLDRQVPLPHSLWLDDLYMSVPALAQMGALTGDRRYFDDAVRQILQFSRRMFVPEKGLYMHGWVQGMETHPAFHWGRANGWAIMAMVELLEVLPADHPGRAAILAQLGAHAAGLAKLQSPSGLWHQLLDRPDSYLETSATAIYAYSIARAINRGWLDKRAYAPMVMLAWNGVATKVNAKGEVEDDCVGTGMAFDPAFYYGRPRSVYASHGYGPVLLAGAEVTTMIRGGLPELSGLGAAR